MKKIILLSFIALSLQTPAAAADKNKCSATTQQGQQCARYAMKDTAKCYQHADNASRCGAATMSGSACKVVVKSKGTKCHIHKSKQDEN